MRLSPGNAIRVVRTARGMSQEQLASAIDITFDMMSLIENDTRNLSLTQFDNVAMALGIPTFLLMLLSTPSVSTVKLDGDALRTLLGQLAVALKDGDLLIDPPDQKPH